MHQQVYANFLSTHKMFLKMSFLKQYRVNLCLLSLLGLAPFAGLYAKPKRIRVFIPLIGYNLVLIVSVYILVVKYVNLVLDIYIGDQYKMSVLLLAQYAYIILLVLLYIGVILGSSCLASLHARFLNSFEDFHNAVSTLSPKKSSLIYRLVAESIVCNLIWCMAIFHMELRNETVRNSIVDSFVVFVTTAFMLHIRSMARLLGNDLKTIRCHLTNSFLTKDSSAIELIEKFLKIKQLFDSAFGPTLAFCAVFDFVLLVVMLYLFFMFFIKIEWTTIGFAEATVAYLVPFIVKYSMLSAAGDEIANEVGCVLNVLILRLEINYLNL